VASYARMLDVSHYASVLGLAACAAAVFGHCRPLAGRGIWPQTHRARRSRLVNAAHLLLHGGSECIGVPEFLLAWNGGLVKVGEN